MFFNFFNTTGEKNVATRERKAATQNQVIYRLYVKYRYLSPSQVYGKLKERYPITSVRRSINTLTRDGMLEKTDRRQKGLYGANECVWRLAD